MKKFTAFTLTEVLITVAVIGVISALTVPNLVKDYQRDTQAVQFRKVVNEIESAIDMFITEEGKTSMASTSLSKDNGFSDFIKSHFKVLKTCSSTETNKCFASQTYMSLDGTSSQTFSCSGESYLLANSAAICARKVEKISINAKKPDGSLILNAYYPVNGIHIELFIDTNGAEGPNIGGRDMFQVYIQPDGRIYDSAMKQEASGICGEGIGGGMSTAQCYAGAQEIIDESAVGCEKSAFGKGCFAKLINNNWKMDY